MAYQQYNTRWCWNFFLTFRKVFQTCMWSGGMSMEVRRARESVCRSVQSRGIFFIFLYENVFTNFSLNPYYRAPRHPGGQFKRCFFIYAMCGAHISRQNTMGAPFYKYSIGVSTHISSLGWAPRCLPQTWDMWGNTHRVAIKWRTHGVLAADMGPTHGIDEETTLKLSVLAC